MANSRTIEFKGRFDGKQVLDELKKIRQNMADAGADDNLFKGIDKDIAATEKLVTEMMAQIQKGFSNTKEVNAFEKQIDKLQTNLLKISSGMQNVNIAENLGLNSPEITSLTKELEQLTAAQDHLKEVSKEALDQAKKSVGLRDDEIAKIKEAIDANEDLEEALKKVGKAREKRFLSQAGEAGMQTQAGKDYIKNANAGLSLSDLGAKASSGNTAKAKNDARKRYDDGELYGGANSRQLDEVKAVAAVTEAYQKTLEKMITSGGNAAEAVEEMKKSLADYGIEIENTDQLQENFYNDIEGFYKSPAVDRGNKGNITKARKIGSTNAQGEYELSDASVQNFLNNSGVTAYSDNMRRATEVTNQLGQEIEEATRRTAELVNENDQGLNNAIQNTNNMTDATKEGAEATREASESAEKMNDTFDNMKGAVKTFLSIGSAVSALKNVVRDTFNDIKELDKSFAKIAMVTDYSVQEMWSSYDQYAAMANELGQSTQSVIQASGLFYQQGLDTAESLALTEDTMKLATLAGLDFEKATSQMTAALRGFHMEMNEGGRVTDVYSELAAKAAADVQQIAYAMSKTASIASSAGMEFETTSAFLTQMIETTQEAPENIGTAMKTIIARFTELKENVAGTEDSEFEDLDYNKVDTALKSVGISLKDASGQFRNLDDVFLELSQKWNTLDRNSQRYIATIAAGSRQQSRFIAMMENYDRTIELVDTAYDSAGKSSEQFAKYQDTVEYKMNQISNSWEQLRTNLFNSDTYKGALDILNNFMSALNNMDFKQILGVAAIGLTLGKSIVTNFITGLKKSSGEIQKSWQTVLNKVFDTKGKSLFETGQLKKTFNDLIKQRPDEEKYVKNMNQVLGDKVIGAPNLETNIEAQKTRELQSQLEVYNQLEVKRKSILQTAQQQLRTGQGITAEVRQQSNQAIRESNQKLQQLNKLAQELGYEKEITAENAKQIAQNMQERASTATSSKLGGIARSAGSSAISAGLTGALMAGISGADFGTVVKTALLSALTAALPSIISAISPFIISILTGPAGIIALASAALIGGTVFILKKIGDANKAAQQAELNRLKAVKETNEELQKLQESQLNTYQSKVSEKSKLNENVQRYRELSNKSYLNSKEQEEFTSIASELNDKYPDIINTYDENTSEITFNTRALESLNSTLQEEIDQERIKIATTANQQIGNYAKATQTTEDLKNKYIQTLEYEMSSQGYKTGNINNAGDAKRQSMGYVIQEDTISGQVIGSASQDLLKSIDIEFAKQAGITEELYTVGTEANIESFIETLQKANISLGEFSQMTIRASELQKEQYNNEVIEKERARVKNILQTTADVDISDEMAEILSYAAEDSAEAIKNQSKNAINTYFKDINKAFGGVDGADENKDFLGAIEDWSFSRMAQNDETISKMKSSLEYLGYSEKANSEEGIKAIEDLFASGTNMVEYDKLTTQMQESLSAIGYSSEDWNNNRKTAEEMTKILQELMTYNMLAQDNVLPDGMNPESIKQSMPQINNFEKTIGDYADKTLQEYTKAIEESKDNISNETIRNSINEYYTKSEDSILYQWQTATEQLESLGMENVENLSYKSATYLNQMIQDLNLSEGKREEIVKAINTNANGLNQAQKDVLFSIDLTQSYGDLLTNSEDYISQLVEAGMNATEAAELFNQYIKGAALIIGNGIFGEEGANIFYDQLNDKISGFKDKYNSIFEAEKEFMEKGSLNSETYFKLLEEGFGEYVDITSDGYILLGEKAEEAWTKMAMQPKEELENSVNVNKELLKQAKSIDTSFKTKTYDQSQVDNGLVLKTTYSTFDDLIAHYQKYKTHVAGITKEQQEYIEAITRKGYATEKEYIKALEDGVDALENMRPDVYIQGLVSLTEAMNQAENQVQDLKDELEDLNKQLDDDKKAVDEAYKTWQEAIHGTEDYQSSLDGLLNYERRLESFNNKLEDTKEALSDISNIDDARNLLEQTTSLYEGKLGTLKAESKVINQSLSNLDKEIMENYANFISLDEFGNMNIDISALESADMSDILKDEGFTKLLEKRNEMYDKAIETDQAYLETVKEWEEQYKTARESEIKMEETIINILKEKMQEEVDTVKDKYAALEEADNNYLDALQEAIDKQRQLREQENQYEDLATKQKKLSLMQRDTSGANQKEVQKLEKEVEDDQQNLLDSEIDNLIESMQELYEKQKEARDLEIEAMEEETENMQAINETAMTIMAGFQSVEDYQAWLLENDKTVEDMTVTQTEQYLDEAKETFAEYAQYVALTTEDMQLRADEINKQADLVFENTNENVSNIGTTIQELAVAASDKAEEEAKEAYDDAVEKMNETQKKIDETSDKLKKAEDDAVAKHGAAMNAMVEASESSIEKVATFAAKALIESSGIDLSNPDEVAEFAEKHNFVNANGEYSQGFINALNDMGYDTSNMSVKQAWQISKTVDGMTVGTEGQYKSRSEALAAIQSDNFSDNVKLSATPIYGSTQVGAFKEEKESKKYEIEVDIAGKKRVQTYDSKEKADKAYLSLIHIPNSVVKKKYAQGGLVNYTGPAWVDGTPTKPEAFLNAQDTQRIGEAAKILAQIPALNGASENVSTNIGDTTIEIHINVENIESDYDVDQMIERVKNDIIDVSKPIGTSVILKK